MSVGIRNFFTILLRIYYALSDERQQLDKAGSNFITGLIGIP